MPDLVVILVIVLVVVLIWRGPKTLPEFGRTLGRAVGNLRREVSKERHETGEDDRQP